jgi:hypothetical protein
MPRGSKSKYTAKQKRQAHHIEQGAKRRGYSSKRAAQIGYATVNKESGGGTKSGSGRGHKTSNASSRKGGRRSNRGPAPGYGGKRTTRRSSRSRSAHRS